MRSRNAPCSGGYVRSIPQPNRHGPPLGLHRPAVRGGIHSARKPADDREAGAGQFAAQLLGDGPTGRRNAARPHDGHRMLIALLHDPADIQERGRVRNHAEPGRVAGIQIRNDAAPKPLEQLQLPIDSPLILRIGAPDDRLRHGAAHAARLHKRRGGRPADRLRRTQRLHEPAQARVTQPCDRAQRQPGPEIGRNRHDGPQEVPSEHGDIVLLEVQT
jgi:hypothetical protein